MVVGSNLKSLMNQPIPQPSGKGSVEIEGFWLPLGGLEPNVSDSVSSLPVLEAVGQN